MDREWLLLVFLLAIGGSVLIVSGLRTVEIEPVADAIAAERRAWRSMLAPVATASIVIAAVIGWAFVEPEDAEVMPLPWFVAALPLALVWARAMVRSARAALSSDRSAAKTYGLLRPRVWIAPELIDDLDPAALDAALAHESAHVRHRDPLRIWFAQLVTDLQATQPARRRFEAWLATLEHARDDEARHAGIAGEDLAAAVIAAVRVQSTTPMRVGAHLTGAEHALRARIERLLRPLPAPSAEPSEHRRSRWIVGLCGALVAGALLGEHVVRILLTGTA